MLLWKMQIGNAAIHDETDWLGMYQYFGSHALVSPRTTRQIEKHCDFSPGITNQTKECNAAFEKVDPNIAYIDLYNIYGPVCLDSNLTAKPKKVSEFIHTSNFIYKYIKGVNLA